MSFTWFAPRPLNTLAQWGAIFLRVIRELDIVDERGAFVCTAMCAFQEAGAELDGIRQIWIPGNLKDPIFRDHRDELPHDSLSDDGYSSGPFQQQMSGPGVHPAWGWGGLYGDPEGTRRRMDPYESTKLFVTDLKKKGFDASNTTAANDSVQRVQGSGRPWAYAKWFTMAQSLYDATISSTPQPPPPPKDDSHMPIADPRTITRITGNQYHPRGLPSPKWIACHTSESMSRVLALAQFCERAGVSYNSLVDDRDILVAVEMDGAPWAAMGANKYAYHICWTSSFAAWSRGAWLDPDAANDGIDERQALRNGAKQIAYWIEQSDVRDHRPIPAVWMGGGSIPPWGRDGLCGHVDFGAWGGGHHDPGPNFPQDVLLSDVREVLTGVAVTSPPPPVPVVAPGTKPDAYSDWMLYRRNPRNDVDRVMRVQHRLKFAYAEYGGHLEVDGDFGPMTYAAVCEFQRQSGLVVDGIVGPNTAAALKP